MYPERCIFLPVHNDFIVILLFYYIRPARLLERYVFLLHKNLVKPAKVGIPPPSKLLKILIQPLWQQLVYHNSKMHKKATLSDGLVLTKTSPCFMLRHECDSSNLSKIFLLYPAPVLFVNFFLTPGDTVRLFFAEKKYVQKSSSHIIPFSVIIRNRRWS